MTTAEIQKIKAAMLKLAGTDTQAFDEVLDFMRELKGIMAAGNPAAEG